MPGQNRDHKNKLCGLLGFIIFFLIAMMSFLFAVDMKDYIASLSVVAVASLCIAITCIFWVLRGESEEDLVDDREEPTGEEIELHDMPVSRREVPGRFSLESIQSIFNRPSSQADSEDSSRTEDDPDIQELVELMKLKKDMKTPPSSASGYLASSEEESRSLETVTDVYSGDETADSSSKEASHETTYSEELELQTFRLTRLHFIDDASSEAFEGAERISPQVTLPTQSSDEAYLAENDESEKEM